MVLEFNVPTAIVAALQRMCRMRRAAAGEYQRVVIGSPTAFIVELARNDASQPMLSHRADLEAISVEQPLVAAAAAAMHSGGTAFERPDLGVSTLVFTVEGVAYCLAWLTFCNGLHHWVIGQRPDGWHHYDDLANHGCSLNMGKQLIVRENGGFINTLGFVRA